MRIVSCSSKQSPRQAHVVREYGGGLQKERVSIYRVKSMVGVNEAIVLFSLSALTNHIMDSSIENFF